MANVLKINNRISVEVDDDHVTIFKEKYDGSVEELYITQEEAELLSKALA